ncbi:MAG: sigma-70 family RNA polymerase sigma factor [Pseudoxanthomonas sp.]|nr:sigma-70 family RNA polymerase sigma factor [Pseudoxanthomonas sp.]
MTTAEITQWLDGARKGDRAAQEAVLSALYRELHGLARRQLDGRAGYTLDATSLVHESYLRLFGTPGAATFEDRAHFFAYAARVMRNVVVDHARSRMADKRGGGSIHTGLPEQLAGALPPDATMLALDSALERLAEFEPPLAQLVELRYFAGFSEPEVAELTGRSERSLRRDWQKARMFLLAALDGGT